MSLKPSIAPFLPLLLAAGLIGCNAVGDGEAPTGILLLPDFVGTARQQSEAADAFIGGEPFRVAECLPATFRMLLEFQNGRREDLATRIPFSNSNSFRFESSDPEVVQIIDIEEEVPIPGSDATGNPLFFPPAVLLPRAPGTATITVDFVGFTASMDVEVLPLGSIDAFPEFPPVVAPNTFSEISARAAFDGQTFGVVAGGVLRLESPTGLTQSELRDFAQVASANNNARQFVFGVQPSPPLRAVLDYGICGRAPATDFRVDLLPEDGLRIDREFDDGQPLGIGFSELLGITGTFADGNEQDLTVDAQLSLQEPPEDAAPVGLLLNAGEVRNTLLFGLAGEDLDPSTEAVEGLGGVATLDARFIQDPSNNIPDGEPPEGVDSQPEVVTALDLPVRPALVRALRWGEPAVAAEDADQPPLLEIPRDCTIQPDILGEVEIALEDDSRVTVTRRINRELAFLIGDDILPDDLSELEEPLPDSVDEAEQDDDNGGTGDGGTGDGAADDDGDAEPEPEPEAIVEVVGGGNFGTSLDAGSITAVGEVGEEILVQAVRFQDTDIPGFEESGDLEAAAPRANLRVRIVEPRDCATVQLP